MRLNERLFFYPGRALAVDVHRHMLPQLVDEPHALAVAVADESGRESGRALLAVKVHVFVEGRIGRPDHAFRRIWICKVRAVLVTNVNQIIYSIVLKEQKKIGNIKFHINLKISMN